MFNRIQPPRTKEEWVERNGSSFTAWIYIYFWLSGLIVLAGAGWALYEYINSNQRSLIFVLRVIVGFTVAALYLTGARQVGRFNRNGLTLIATGWLIGTVAWVIQLPSKDDLIWAVLTIIALVIAWHDLAPEGHGVASRSP
jgi:hypothetical protein